MTKRVALHVLYFAVVVAVAFAVLNAASLRIIEKKAALGRYVINARARDGHGYMMYCYEGAPAGFEYDVALDRLRPGQFTEMFVLGDRKVDPACGGRCVAYPGESVELQGRLSQLPPKRAGERRIVFIGDSFTYGLGVRQGRAFPERLAAMFALRHKRGGQDVTVLNFGKLGADFPALYEDNFRTALLAQPDEIIYVWMLNDATTDAAERDRMLKGNDFVNLESMYAEGGHAPPLFRLVAGALRERRISKRTTEWYLGMYGSANSAGLKRMRGLLRRMKKESAAVGAEFRAVYFPVIAGDARRYPFRAANAAMDELLDSEHISHNDLTGSVLSRPARELWVHPLDHHPNAEAHRLAAEEIFRHLESGR